ncbi:type VI secretion system (T6SS) effector Tae4 (amidase) [Paraburkholderia eburnea]|uniref:Type VI secretion system (T6SS) effector Tae4 (Amidase) n=1 Tax=Paraburkholderia eburnea TaxID=1189126 RepID=A0A2S4MBX3_9BURK|nr:T6SS effector amidase Tae4 family protein [Paraburkholderia eburnea]POR52232.1 type VI secretion system (T6SS) effector Tae4 (amidase) [Paraburkholderia eburnea]PRZ23123.1 type VI secretion system (T6SS) effector Tae4 (amidase) [Paraburkholderia eburnea]
MPNKRTGIQTNSTPNSVKEIKLRILTFNELWENYPSGNPYNNPAYPDQCAIRLSVAFHRVGIEMKSFSSNLIRPLSGQPSIGRIILDGKATATRANELAEWLRFRPIASLGKTEDITGKDWLSRIKGRTGIIMFDGYWPRDGETAESASGGHIDLWNGTKLTGIGTGFRVNWNIVIPGIWEDFRKSRTILFFPLK